MLTCASEVLVQRTCKQSHRSSWKSELYIYLSVDCVFCMFSSYRYVLYHLRKKHFREVAATVHPSLVERFFTLLKVLNLRPWGRVRVGLRGVPSCKLHLAVECCGFVHALWRSSYILPNMLFYPVRLVRSVDSTCHVFLVFIVWSDGLRMTRSGEKIGKSPNRQSAASSTPFAVWMYLGMRNYHTFKWTTRVKGEK